MCVHGVILSVHDVILVYSKNLQLYLWLGTKNWHKRHIP